MEVNGRSSHMFRELEEKIRKKIDSWKFKFLSQAGRVVLCNSILVALLSHIISIYLLPKQVSRRITTTMLRNRVPQNTSWAMKGILKSVADLKRGFRMEIGNGEKTRIEHDMWAGEEKIKMKGGRSGQCKPIWVAELINNNGNWNATKIWQWFDRETARKILTINLPLMQSEDKMVWKFTSSGEVTVKTAYWQDSRKECSGKGKIWEVLWKLNVFPKWKMFFWKLWHNALPVMDRLVKLGMQVDDRCQFCMDERESHEHLFRDCMYMQRIWKASMLGISSLHDNHIPLKDWTRNWILYLYRQGEGSEDVIQYFLAILWAIWLTRNEVRFNGQGFHLKKILKVAENWISRCQKRKKQEKVYPTRKQERVTNLTKGTLSPNQKPVILMCKGRQVKDKRKGENFKATFGWVIYMEGRKIEEDMGMIYATSTCHAELIAYRKAIQRAKDHSSIMILWTDSQKILNILTGQSPCNANIRSLREDILKLSNSLQYFVCRKVDKVVIKEANELANLVRTYL
ncbi:hypothetical protein RDABS01_029804 [Bienertia sinuspersici]